MANIVIGSKFQPFSYQELLAPVQQATLAHQLLEEQYGTLATDAALIEALLDEQTDTKSYNMYKGFTEELKNYSDILSKEGLNPNVRQQLIKMKTRYGSEIEPIKAASEEFNRMRQYRELLQGRDNSVLFKNQYNTIDDFLGGRKADNSYISGKDITARVAAKSEAIGKALFSTPEFTEILNKQKYQVMQRNGATPDQITQVLMQDPDAQPALRKVYQDEWEAIGADSYNEDAQRIIDNSISTGLYAALQKPTYNYLNNADYINAGTQRSLALLLANMTGTLPDGTRTLAGQRQDEIVRQNLISSGLEPYRVDNKGIKYFDNGTATWTEDAEGNTSTPQFYKRQYDAQGRPLYLDKEEEKESLFILDYTGNKKGKKAGFTGTSDEGFSTKNSSLIQFNELGEKKRRKLLLDLEKAGLTIDDVDIYYDRDRFSKDHYRVVRKGYEKDGMTKKKVSTPTSISAPSVGDEPAGL